MRRRGGADEELRRLLRAGCRSLQQRSALCTLAERKLRSVPAPGSGSAAHPERFDWHDELAAFGRLRARNGRNHFSAGHLGRAAKQRHDRSRAVKAPVV